jgi:hypothetical protein
VPEIPGDQSCAAAWARPDGAPRRVVAHVGY